MTNIQATLIGAAMIAASIIVSNGIHPALAQQGGGPYQLMHHSNTVANAGVFRLDTSSGDVSYCYINGDQALTCSHAVR
ncbi:MAG: hypothetical protein P4M13_05760 [Alphaproteobacteria bacterium]|nr:hypothetical protein [Alphaproteobacteria bacterium]